VNVLKKTVHILNIFFVLFLVFIIPAIVTAADPEMPAAGTTPQPPQEIKQPVAGPQPPQVKEATPVEPKAAPVEPKAAPVEPKAAPVEPKEEPPVPQKEQKPPAPQTVSFFFDDADIFEVAQTIFADVLRVNYIIDPQVKGRVNFRTISPVPKSEVLNVMEIILRLNGIGFVEEGGIYRIIPLTEVSKELIYSQIGKAPEKVAIEMFAFKNLSLRESMADIENALGLQLKGGTVRIIPIYRLNALIVVASAKEHLDYIRKWVGVFDEMFITARPKIYVYPLQNSKAPYISSLLQAIFTGSAPPAATTSPTTAPKAVKQPVAPTTAPKAGPSVTMEGAGGATFVGPDTRVFADEITNSLIILATPGDYSFIEETIKRLDIMPRQVVIEGLVAQVTLSDNLSFGVSWSLKTNADITNIKPFNKDINLDGNVFSIPQGSKLDNTAGDGFTFVATDPTGIVRARLTAALATSKAKVLAAPHILVSDNREARIQVGSQVPLATSTSTAIPTSGTVTESTTVTSTIQYKDIGIILTVKPQINDSGLVSLELTQEISSVGKPATIAGQDFSSIDKTETTTNLVAQDGETIIIGGLIREDATKQKNGIPLLSKIPLIGSLFSYTSNTLDRTELIILLTPRVIKNQKEAGNVTTDYVDRYKGVSKDEDIDQFVGEKGQGNQK
jgi:type II secretion system protein D